MNRKLLNIIKGKKARSEGMAFEEHLAQAARLSGLRVVPIPMGCRQVRGRGGFLKLVRVKSPFDMLISHPSGKSAFIDSKSISDDRVVYSFLTPHQVDILSDLESDGHVAGYVVHFKTTGQVVFFKGSQLQALQRRESILPSEGKDLGSVYRMNLKGLFQCQD